MEIFWHELTYGLPDREHLETVIIRVITAIVLGGIILSPFGPAARAQSTLNAESKAKAEVMDRLNKKETRVKVKLRNGSELKGRITQSTENGFTLVDEKTGSSSDIVYADVLRVEGSGMSKSKKILIATGVGVGIFIAVVAYAITHLGD